MKDFTKSRRLIPALLISILVLSIFTITGYSAQVTTGFEDGTAGNPYNNGWLITDIYNGNTFEVDDDNTFYGDLAFNITDSGTTPCGYFNFSLAQPITTFSTYVEFDDDNADVQFYFFDSNDETIVLGAEATMIDNSIIAIQLNGDGANPEVVEYANSGHTWTTINSTITTFIGIGFINMGFIINDNNNVSYWYGDELVYGTPANPGKLNAGFGIDSIFIKGSANAIATLDNLVIQSSVSEGEGGDEAVEVDFEYYNETYGDYFVEINKNWVDCYYSVNDYPQIVYRLPTNTSCPNSFTCEYKYNVSLVYQSGEVLFSRTVVGHNITTLGDNYIGKFPYLGIYWLEVYNETLSRYNDSLNQTLFYISDPIRVCDYAEANEYTVTITPDQEVYAVNDTVNILITKTGDDIFHYALYEPRLNNPEVEGTSYGTSVSFNYTFSEAWANPYYCIGNWVLKVYDEYGTPQDDNAVNLIIQVDIEGVPIGDITQEQLNFIMGFTLILVFVFIGIGVATRLQGNSQLGIIFLFAVLGSIITQLWGLLPLWIPFLIGMIFVGYVVKELYD